jgi:syntaxin 5
MFDDPIVEIQELTSLIKNDITTLNVALSDLQTIQNIEIADGNFSEDRVGHSTAVFDDLKGKLMGATKQLQNVLTARTEVCFNKHIPLLFTLFGFYYFKHMQLLIL